jgi:hypothetical protein
LSSLTSFTVALKKYNSILDIVEMSTYLLQVMKYETKFQVNLMCVNNQHHPSLRWLRVTVFNATFNNISVILMEETGVVGENHRHAVSY